MFYIFEQCHKDASNGLLQFSVTEHVKTAEVGRLQSLPAVFFFYDLSPIKVGFPYMLSTCEMAYSLFVTVIADLFCMLQVTFTEEHVSFLHFLTNVCAIVGGI